MIEIIFLSVMLVVVTVLLRFGYCRFMKAAYPLKFSELVTSYAEEYGFEPSLVYAVIRTESGFDPQAVSYKKAIGLMQITKDTFDWAQIRSPEKESLPAERLYDPEINIHYGIRVLSLLKEEFSDTTTMLAAYNAGIGNVRRWLKDPAYSDDGVRLKSIPFRETRNYVRKIPSAKWIYERLYNIN